MESLNADLEAACLRALRAAWDDVNQGRFRGALRPPALELADAGSRLGRWEPATRTIQLSRALVLDGGWPQALEVLKHEMAHQYVWEVLGERGETPHGPSFVATCERLGIDAAASGPPPSPAGAEAGARRDRLVDRVAKLLALAGSPNEHEARVAMAAAQRLMLKHNIASAGRPGEHRYGFRHLGAPSGRIPEAQRILAGMLGAHFFVECLWIPVWRPREGKRGLLLEICGRPENLELAAHVHAFLLATADRLWRDWRRAQRAAAEPASAGPLPQAGRERSEPRRCARGEAATCEPKRGAAERPASARPKRASGANRERRAFEAGVMTGFRETLERQAERQRAEALVWVGDADLRRYHRRRHPYVRSTSYTLSPRSAARDAGQAAGREVVLHRPMSAAADGGGRRRLTGR